MGAEGGEKEGKEVGGKEKWEGGQWRWQLGGGKEVRLNTVTLSFLLLSSPDPRLEESGIQNHHVATDSPDFAIPGTAPARSKHCLPMRP